MNKRPTPSRCPSCESSLVIVKLECPQCATEVMGEYDLCPTCRLEGEQRRLFELFLEARGNVRGVQRVLGVSYPTVRQRLHLLFEQLEKEPPTADPMTVLQQVREGDLTVGEAELLLKGDPLDR